MIAGSDRGTGLEIELVGDVVDTGPVLEHVDCAQGPIGTGTGPDCGAYEAAEAGADADCGMKAWALKETWGRIGKGREGRRTIDIFPAILTNKIS